MAKLVGKVAPYSRIGLGPNRPGMRIATRRGRDLEDTSSLGTLKDLKPGQIRIKNKTTGEYVDCLLNTEGIQQVGGGPRVDVSERVKKTGIPEYRGHDPLEIAVSIVLDLYDEEVDLQPYWNILQDCTGRVAGTRHMPIVTLGGPSAWGRYTRRLWVANGPLEENDYPTARFIKKGGELIPVRQALTIPLMERVPDTQFREQMGRLNEDGKGKGHKQRTIIAKQGDSFSSISKRVYGSRNRAPDIARANTMAFGAHLKKGMKIKLPQ